MHTMKQRLDTSAQWISCEGLYISELKYLGHSYKSLYCFTPTVGIGLLGDSGVWGSGMNYVLLRHDAVQMDARCAYYSRSLCFRQCWLVFVRGLVLQHSSKINNFITLTKNSIHPACFPAKMLFLGLNDTRSYSHQDDLIEKAEKKARHATVKFAELPFARSHYTTFIAVFMKNCRKCFSEKIIL